MSSIDSVLDAPPNVRNSVEVEIIPKDPFQVTWSEAQEFLARINDSTIPAERAIDLSFAINTLYPNQAVQLLDRSTRRLFGEFASNETSKVLREGAIVSDAVDAAVRISMIRGFGLLDLTVPTYPNLNEAVQLKDRVERSDQTEGYNLAFALKYRYPKIYEDLGSDLSILSSAMEGLSDVFVRPGNAMRKLAFARVLVPDTFQRWGGASNIDWNFVEFMIENGKSQGINDWIELAAYSQVIRADRAELTDKGIVISNRPSSVEVPATLPLPETRFGK